jgi:hypothetical protein
MFGVHFGAADQKVDAPHAVHVRRAVIIGLGVVDVPQMMRDGVVKNSLLGPWVRGLTDSVI